MKQKREKKYNEKKITMHKYINICKNQTQNHLKTKDVAYTTKYSYQQETNIAFVPQFLFTEIENFSVTISFQKSVTVSPQQQHISSSINSENALKKAQ